MGATIVSRIDNVKAQLAKEPKKWLITGVAGFIGSNLLEALLNSISLWWEWTIS